MTARSPAPWNIEKGAYGALWAGPAQLPHPGRDSMRLEERMAERAADAALIAAAPDMLVALQTIALHISTAPGTGLSADGVREIARAAIAKAEGGAV